MTEIKIQKSELEDGTEIYRTGPAAFELRQAAGLEFMEAMEKIRMVVEMDREGWDSWYSTMLRGDVVKVTVAS